MFTGSILPFIPYEYKYKVYILSFILIDLLIYYLEGYNNNNEKKKRVIKGQFFDYVKISDWCVRKKQKT
jgi:hypothetical protein